MHKKNKALLTCLFIYTHFGCLSLELNRVPGVLLEPYMSQGGQGSAELPMVLKRLITSWFVLIFLQSVAHQTVASYKICIEHGHVPCQIQAKII